MAKSEFIPLFRHDMERSADELVRLRRAGISTIRGEGSVDSAIEPERGSCILLQNRDFSLFVHRLCSQCSENGEEDSA